jgi:hypothetical protein
MMSSAFVGGIGSQASRTLTSVGPTAESANSWPLTRSDKATFGEYLDEGFMSYSLSHLVRAQAYADDKKTSLVREDPFGYGMDGTLADITTFGRQSIRKSKELRYGSATCGVP